LERSFRTVLGEKKRADGVSLLLARRSIAKRGRLRGRGIELRLVGRHLHMLFLLRHRNTAMTRQTVTARLRTDAAVLFCALSLGSLRQCYLNSRFRSRNRTGLR